MLSFRGVYISWSIISIQHNDIIIKQYIKLKKEFNFILWEKNKDSVKAWESDNESIYK